MQQEKKLKAVSEMLKEQFSANKNAVFHVISNSMEPLITVGDSVLVKPVKLADLAAGNVILFCNGDTFCTHRFVITINVGNITKLVTKGDRLRGFDKPFNEDKILGRVITILRQDDKIDLFQGNYRLFNRMFGKLLVVQWFVFKTGHHFQNYFNSNFNNRAIKLVAKITVLFFCLSYKLLDYFLLWNSVFNKK